jgi:hypothetical protein
MRSQAVRLPDKFPVGTRYVVEGRAGRISLRYLEFPDGRHVILPTETSRREPAPRHRMRHRTTGRK